MKDKVLETIISAGAENIARALRNYSGEPMTCRIRVETRQNKEGQPDVYGIRVRYKKTHVLIQDKNTEVFYTIDRDGREVITKTEALKNDTQVES